MNSSGLLGFVRVNLTEKPITLLPQLRQGFFAKICIVRSGRFPIFSKYDDSDEFRKVCDLDHFNAESFADSSERRVLLGDL
jgi:hypothetical protein